MKEPGYNAGIVAEVEESPMPKKTSKEGATFGERLVALREAAGYTQQELADEVGVSRRMIAYYEGQSAHPPTTLLPAIAKALGVSTDALLGMTPISRRAQPANRRLQRRLQQIEQLGAREKRQVLQVLDAFLEREKLKQRLSAEG
jgi:transcriptional regulator with XRE-family HTH domain